MLTLTNAAGECCVTKSYKARCAHANSQTHIYVSLSRLARLGVSVCDVADSQPVNHRARLQNHALRATLCEDPCDCEPAPLCEFRLYIEMCFHGTS